MNARHLFLSVASAALLASAPAAFAASQHVVPAPEAAPAAGLSDAFASLSLGGASLTGDDLDTISGLTVEGAASGEYAITPSLGVQGDVVYRTQQFQFSGDSDPEDQVSEHDFEAAVHGFTRNDKYLVGVFGQYGEGALGFLGGLESVGVTHVFGGVEGQLFLNDATTLYAQVGAKHYDFGDIASATGFFGTFEARYLLQPDFKIDAHVGYETLDAGAELTPFSLGSETTTNVGVGAEYRVADTPFSVFAKYDYSKNTFDEGSIWNNRILAGVKFNFDAPTLLARDRSGASLKPLESHDFDYGAAITIR